MIVSNDSIEIEISRNEVCHYVGYEAGFTPPARILTLIDDYVKNVDCLIEPASSYTILNIDSIENDRIYIEGDITFKSQVIADALKHCDKIAIFLVTIGDHLEEISRKLAEDGLVLQAAVLDAIGSDAVEKVADFVQQKIRTISSYWKLVINQRRFSPGYCDWGIEQQEILFRAIDNNSIEVSLTDEYLMIPRKSLSGIFGIGLPGNGIETYNSCSLCNKNNCHGRR